MYHDRNAPHPGRLSPSETLEPRSSCEIRGTEALDRSNWAQVQREMSCTKRIALSSRQPGPYALTKRERAFHQRDAARLAAQAESKTVRS